MNTNGIISLRSGFSVSVTALFPLSGSDILIAPFWDNINTDEIENSGATGDIFFRVCTNQSVLTQAGTFISEQFSVLSVDFTPDFLLVVTWDQVTPFSSPDTSGVNVIIICSRLE